MPCSACGAAVERGRSERHVCERDRVVEFQMFRLRDEVAAVENEVRAYFESAQGRFEAWWAERERRRNAG
jgi:hypothetical protein